MKAVVDTNVLVALWDLDDALNSAARLALDTGVARGGLVIPALVYAELMASPRRTEEFLDSFFGETGILVDWALSEKVWRSAGHAFRKYAARRRKEAVGAPRRILADFVIGAYAAHHGYGLLTLDAGVYRSAFPDLMIVAV